MDQSKEPETNSTTSHLHILGEGVYLGHVWTHTHIPKMQEIIIQTVIYTVFT
jgi:hypothetical protein